MWTCCAYPAPSVVPSADQVRPRAARALVARGRRVSTRSRRTSDMPARSRRGQGQWAMGHHEPLNAAERFKKDDPGLNVRERIVNHYAAAGFDSIDPTDLRGRFRWWGLYTQRRPGIPGGKTGALEDADVEDAYFMMRVRIPGGQLTSSQLRAVAGIAKEYGRDLADITDRQNVQFHWIRIEDVPAI